MIEIKNAIIVETEISDADDWGFVTLTLSFKGDGWGMVYSFPIGTIDNIFKITGVKNYDKIKGKAVRIKLDDYNFKDIGHIIEDIWYYNE